jgi:hypothetical protein
MTEIEMTSLLIELANLGVTGIKIHYDGGGDSGSIENIWYTTEKCSEPTDVDDAITWDTEEELSNLSSSIRASLENYAYNLLDDVEDWWNNEGGYGDLCIVVPSGKYEISNNIKVVHTEHYLHEGNLINKAVNKINRNYY